MKSKTYSVVLVGGDGGELGLGEDETFEVALGRIFEVFPAADVDDVETRLVSMHRVEDYLTQKFARRSIQ